MKQAIENKGTENPVYHDTRSMGFGLIISRSCATAMGTAL